MSIPRTINYFVLGSPTLMKIFQYIYKKMQHLLTFIILLFVFHSKSTSLYLLQNVVGAECSRCRIVAAECLRCRMLSLQNVMIRCKLMLLWWVGENQWSLYVNDESVMSQWWVGDELIMSRWWVGNESVMSRWRIFD